MSIYCPLSEALRIEYIPSEKSSHNPLQKEFDPSYMGNRGVFNAFYGKKHTEETKQIIREKRAKQILVPHTEETKKKISETLKGHYVSEESKQKMRGKRKSYSSKGKPKRTTICPHCGKEGAIAMMKRWHFDNCKEKL